MDSDWENYKVLSDLFKQMKISVLLMVRLMDYLQDCMGYTCTNWAIFPMAVIGTTIFIFRC